MNKIEKIYQIIKKRLPYKIESIRLYKNPQTLLKAYCKNYNKDYKKIIKYYTKYLNTHRYMETKYFSTRKSNSNKFTAFDIIALATNPISLAKNKLIRTSKSDIAFLILHEIGHFFVGMCNEIGSDKFAIRWVRKLIKEKLI